MPPKRKAPGASTDTPKKQKVLSRSERKRPGPLLGLPLAKKSKGLARKSKPWARKSPPRARPGKSKKQRTTSQKPCPGKRQSECTSPCKWASGTKRQFCRIETNEKNTTTRYMGDDIYFKTQRSNTKPMTGCKGKPQTLCSSPCKWANGEKRQFCRTEKNKK